MSEAPKTFWEHFKEYLEEELSELGFPSKDDVKEVLREELGFTDNPSFRAVATRGWNYVTEDLLYKPASLPYVTYDPYGLAYTWDDEPDILIADLGRGQFMRIGGSERKKLVWFKDLGTLDQPRSIDFNPVTRHILVGEIGKISIWDEDGNKVKEITSLSSGESIGRSRATWSRYGDELENEIICMASDNHFVAKIDVNGTVLWTYGTPGTPGSGANQLNNPCFFSHSNGKDERIIADCYNDRVIEVSEDKTVTFTIPYPHPTCAWLRENRWLSISSEFRYPAPSVIMGDYAEPFIYFPTFSNQLVLDKWFRRALLTYKFTVYEVYLPRYRNFSYPQSFSLAIDESVSAGDTWTSVPCHLYPWENKTLFVYSDQPADLYIDAMQPSNGTAPLKFKAWREYDHVTLPAGELTPYIITGKIYVARFRVVMGSTNGTIQVWISGW